jgi:hypothetical protein
MKMPQNSEAKFRYEPQKLIMEPTLATILKHAEKDVEMLGMRWEGGKEDGKE